MTFTRAQEIASWYQSPGPDGRGFATFASTGKVTDQLWDDIRRMRRDASKPQHREERDDWLTDMDELINELARAGHWMPPLHPRGGAYNPMHDVYVVGDWDAEAEREYLRDHSDDQLPPGAKVLRGIILAIIFMVLAWFIGRNLWSAVVNLL